MEKNVMISIRTTETMKEKLTQIADGKDISVSQLIREVLKKYLEE